ncbi:pentatricopeptide repeat-containing protein At3g24000, mitochondrial-like [Solanum dulcamara]|uniref:pentatricopeptide repeat-containing protein At3g24000, mitochondrial-like n=1 Tax=Solanum dulcamara TaxID=45834 RepID=UPI0024866E1D|nr:pentatricopeptide repeat-containing protein At3g24000, mitochondrial-like [Solanum dulcamara]XP_055818859.1 pentatricopeptide repeat-containing protein At3g24000, mitochondrial-like [Solanum dulcamara]XP_055818860.1 pentatricopeptide repeat-containing protein At3g24000, mitochondrial-like [Solanum dulcamara]XP_055818861.1 pentatricopeptide repeat-containing protein At3g24000, mitochondrial-like [Solanum dulcamara]
MELDFLSAHMRNPPIFRGIFSSFYPVPRTRLILCPNESQLGNFSLFPSVHFNCFSCAAVQIVEPNCPSVEKKQNFQDSVGSRRLSTKELKYGTKKRLVERGDGGFLIKDKKRGLKWYSEMLKDYAAKLCLKEGKALHGEMVRSGVEPDSHLWVSLVNFYSKCGDLVFAENAFDLLPNRDVVSWTALIAGFIAQGYGSKGIFLFREMRGEDIRPNEFTLATVLKGCSMCLDLEFGKQLHAEVVKGAPFSDVYVGSALVDLYAKCCELESAVKVFFSMPEQNSVSWNVLLNGYVQAGQGEEALKLFLKMPDSEMRFSNYTLSTILKGCANSVNLKAGQVIHSMLVKIGSEIDDFTSCSLVDMYNKCGLQNDALKVFLRTKNPDTVAWTAMISGLDQQGQKREAIQLFCLMRHSGLRPNQFTLASVVSAAADSMDLRCCKSIHACVYKFSFDSEEYVSNALIAMYMKFGSVLDGYRIFSSLSNRDIISWNSLLSGFHDNGTSYEGPKIFRQLLVEGLRPNIYTLISNLRSCASLSDASLGKQVHAHVVKTDLGGNVYVGTALVDMYAKCGQLDDAELIFYRLSEKDVFTWTVVISGYAQSDQGEKAFRCFNQMQREAIKPNEFTLASCLKGCSRIASLDNGRQLHSVVMKSGQFSDMYVASALIDMYAKSGCIIDAESLFQSMGSSDTVLWNTIIYAYSQHGLDEKALETFRTMLSEGIPPDGITFLAVLSACSHLGLVKEGRRHFDSIKNGFGITPSMEHYACMVDILGRAGKFNEMEHFIEGMELAPDALIWETVLGVCKAHGNVELAEKAANTLFEIDPKAESSYILLSNIYASKGRWADVSRVRALMSRQGVKKEPGCSWTEIDNQVHVFLSQDASHPKLKDIHKKLTELASRITAAGYIPNTDYVLHNVSDKEKIDNLSHHSERLALAFALMSSSRNSTVRIFKNLCICGDCHEFMKLASIVTNREIVIRDINLFHHFSHGTCSCKDYW